MNPSFPVQEIFVRGDTICPSCRKPTPAIWMKTPSTAPDPYRPSRYLGNNGFTSDTPDHIELKFTCQHCQHTHRQHAFSDARYFYRSDVGESSCGSACACRASTGDPAGPLGNNALGTGRKFRAFDHFDNLSPCVTLIEIVRTCNWTCGTCLAEAADNTVLKPGDYVPLEDFKSRIDGIIGRRDEDIEILQLSGGEPTLHPQFFELLGWSLAHPRIRVVMINTNGSKIVMGQFQRKLEEINAKYSHKLHIYLKFNGPSKEAQFTLSSFDAHPHELRAIAAVEKMGIATTLAMTVVPSNLSCVWRVAEIGLKHSKVRGVSYQPRFGGGRHEEQLIGQLVDTGHVINHLIDQAHPTLGMNSILPMPCGDPNCHSIGMLHRPTMRCIGSAVSDEERMKLLGFLKDKISYGSQDLSKCGCETTEFGQLVHNLEATGNMFRLSIKPFMTFGHGSLHNFNCNRTDQCCTAVVGHDGRLNSFCNVYNGLAPDNPLWVTV